MSHLPGQSRSQGQLLPAVLDDFVTPDHPVRVIDAFVEGLDLEALGFARVKAAVTGRPGFAPGSLLKLYVYGYLNEVRSSRRLARECARNTEVMWLLKHLVPSFKTIADFRRDHPGAIVGVCGAFTRFCRGQGLFSARLVAVDGSKVGAVASRKRVMTPKRIAKVQAKLDRRIEDYLQSLDRADASDAEPAEKPEDVQEALKALNARREELTKLAVRMKAEGSRQEVEGEPEAKLMRGAHGYRVAYNAQIAVDEQHHLIVASEVTNEGNDHRQLLPMSEAAQQVLEVETLTVVADTGYVNGEQGRACSERGITAVVPRAETVNPKGEDYFTRERFEYDAENDVYRCPAGEVLSRRRHSKTEQKYHYWSNRCGECPLKAQCTGSKHRVIVRSYFEADVEAMHQRAMDSPATMKQRRCLAEHPFGTMKALMGTARFLVRGLTKVRGEFALSVLTYNLKRVVKVLGVQELMERIANWQDEMLVPASA